MKQKNLLSANLILAIISTVFFGSFFAANSVSASHATAVCETNTMKSGTFCNWTDSNSWCGGNTLTCQLEPDAATVTPTAVANGSWNFCNSCSWTLTCNGGFTKCAASTTCVATKTCLAGQTFNACTNLCEGTTATLKLAFDSVGSTYLVNSPTPVLSIGSDGNVGIDTTVPNDVFSIGNSGSAPVGAVNTGHNYTMSYLTTDPYALVNYGTTMSLINAATSSSSVWGGTTSGNIWSLNSGNVGIGTTAPISPLDVNGIISSGYTSGSGEIKSYQAAASPTLYVSLKTDNVTTHRSGIFRSNAGFFSYYNTLTGDIGMDAQYSGANLLFQIGSVEKMRLSNNGNVGIGITNPSQKLQVTGSIQTSGNLFMNTSGGSTGISWYMPSYYTWFDYMKNGGGGIGPNGLAVPTDVPSGVTTWARRFNTESNATYGWIFESGGNSTSSAATVKFAINAGTGTFHTIGGGIIDGNLGIGTSIPNDKFSIGNAGVAPVGSLATGHNYTMTYLSTDQYALVNYGTVMTLLNSATTTNALWNGTKNGNIWNGDAGVGNVGIGTTNPVTKAHLYGTLTVDPNGITNSYSEGIRVGAASNGYSIVTLGANPASATGAQANQWWIGKDGRDNGFNIWGNSPGDAFHILPSGNVGIGTTAPNDKLDVSGNGRFTWLGKLSFEYDNIGSYSRGIKGLARGLNIFTLENDSNGGILFTTGSTASPTDVMKILNNGNVGIGTTLPASKLEVGSGNIEVGDGYQLGWRYSAGDGNMYNSIVNNYTTGGGIQYKSGSWASNTTLIAHNFQTWMSSAWQSSLVILQNGNVGIGTTAPNDTFSIGTAAGVAPAGIAGTGHNYTASYLGADSYALVNYGILISSINGVIASSTSNNPVFVGLSTVTYNGNNNANNGYTYAQARCSADQAGAHVCTPDEILNTIAKGKTMPAEDAWIFAGPPGYTAAANDCEGRSIATTAARGTYWQKAAVGRPDGRGLLMLCDQTLKLACCR